MSDTHLHVEGQFKIPPLYREWGGPLRWQDEQSGVLVNAVSAYFHHGQKHMLRGQMKVVCEYLRYYIFAPCWDMNPHHDEESRKQITTMRERIIAIQNGPLADEREIERWIMECLEIGIDPL